MSFPLGKATRDAYGEALVALGAENPDIVVLDADLSKSTKSADFGKKFPDRFFNMGIQEANLVGTAAGLAASGKIPFASSFATFVMSKGYDQLRCSAAFPEFNVKIVGSHGGISIGEDGPSQMAIEDIALATSLPNFTVVIPADEHACRALTRQLADHDGPCFMRTGRPKAPIVYSKDTQFRLGKAQLARMGRDATVVANGLLVAEALTAAEELAAESGLLVRVLDMHTIKPIDVDALTAVARETGAIVVAEEHQLYGGLGSVAARVLAQRHPVPMEFVAIQDCYAESATPEQLMERYGLTARHVKAAILRVLERKAGGGSRQQQAGWDVWPRTGPTVAF